MRLRLRLLVLCLMIILFVVYNMASYQRRQTALDEDAPPFDTMMESDRAAVKVSGTGRATAKVTHRAASTARVGFLPHGIVEPYSDMELKPLWLTRSVQSEEPNQKDRCLIAIPAGINQKKSVDALMKKRTLQLYYSTTMGRSMIGMIYHGAKV
ncbi:uncharacterized protein LOC123425677 isoform X3 [Hordeum vulgare subsp. vulgare]|uniref:uncharacterized protein LOC123425677 isoform X3 n=1 Tax=Hordeum vulgare subsp. vulgare TaxID=112509 RepID=UPI001D1A38C6|nr:uncharacterized protein LOC123425677 isoform X3 [Hordeum vulgare subsp. vulgare]